MKLDSFVPASWVVSLLLSSASAASGFDEARLTGLPDDLAVVKQMTLGKLPSAWEKATALCGAPADARCVVAKTFELMGQAPSDARDSASRCFEMARTSGYVPNFGQQMHPAGVEETWTHDEIAWIHRALDVLPADLRFIPTVIGFTRIAVGHPIPSTPGAAAEATSPINIAATFMSEETTGVTVIHEIAHHFDRLHGDRGFQKLTRWDELHYIPNPPPARGRGGWQTYQRIIPDGKFVTAYASSGPEEDFAESMGHCLLNPEAARKLIPEKCAFIAASFN